MPVPSPREIIHLHGCRTPEQLAGSLGFQVTRTEAPPLVPGVTVLSEYVPNSTIMLYRRTLRQQAERRGEPLERLEQWHIAHELYHGLAEQHPLAAWRVRETEADVWADELLALITGGKSAQGEKST